MVNCLQQGHLSGVHASASAEIPEPKFGKLTKNEDQRGTFSIFTIESSYARYRHEPSEEYLHTPVATSGGWYNVEIEFLHACPGPSVELTLPATLKKNESKFTSIFYSLHRK
jgi:hypothetical protein